MRNSEQIELEGNFKIRNWILITDIGVSIILTVLIGSFFLRGLYISISEIFLSFPPSNIYEYILVAGFFVIAALHLFMIALIAFATRINIRCTYRMFSMSIGTTNTGISILTRTGKYFINKADFVYILGFKHLLQLIWKHGDYHTLLSFRKNLFGKAAFAQMQKLVAGWDSYMEDYEKKMAIRKQLRPINMFSTNQKIWNSYWKNSV